MLKEIEGWDGESQSIYIRVGKVISTIENISNIELGSKYFKC